VRSGRIRWRVVPGPLLLAALAWCGPTAAHGQRAADASGPAAAADSVSTTDDLTPVRSITVSFDNGKATVSRGQRAQLQQLVKEAQRLRGYMIRVAVDASVVSPEPNDLRLNMERASAVTAILRQCEVPLANVIVSAASGDLPDAPSSGPAQNRRAVVTLLEKQF
jgi:outer membrane protein OmpA-like peptidoglycan-associated protein